MEQEEETARSKKVLAAPALPWRDSALPTERPGSGSAPGTARGARAGRLRFTAPRCSNGATGASAELTAGAESTGDSARGSGWGEGAAGGGGHEDKRNVGFYDKGKSLPGNNKGSDHVAAAVN